VVSDRLPTQDDWSAAATAGSTASAAGAPASAAATLRIARIPAALLEAVVDAARAGYPNEACGLLVGDRPASGDGVPARYVPLTNAAASPYRYLIDPQEQLQVMLELDDAGEVVWAIVHSHVASPPVPSATDVGLAFYPDSLYVICSLAGNVPEVRAWSIRDGTTSEVALAVG
jgi:[CysO sulfur-carrier protein]-S-L-cysteine hydrolase